MRETKPRADPREGVSLGGHSQAHRTERELPTVSTSDAETDHHHISPPSAAIAWKTRLESQVKVDRSRELKKLDPSANAPLPLLPTALLSLFPSPRRLPERFLGGTVLNGSAPHPAVIPLSLLKTSQWSFRWSHPTSARRGFDLPFFYPFLVSARYSCETGSHTLLTFPFVSWAASPSQPTERQLDKHRRSSEVVPRSCVSENVGWKLSCATEKGLPLSRTAVACRIRRLLHWPHSTIGRHQIISEEKKKTEGAYPRSVSS